MSRRRAIAHLGQSTAQQVDVTAIDTLLRTEGALLWLDIEGPTEEDIGLLREEFGFHELSLEDALRRKQRPKVDEYEDYYFIVLYSAASTAEHAITTNEVHCFWGRNYVVTLHEEPIPEVQVAVNRWAGSPARPDLGVAYQVYALLDALIDGYFPAVDALAERIEDIEAAIFGDGVNIMEEVFALRRELLDARRVLGPSRDVLNVLIRRDVPVCPLELIPYLADVYDHAIRVIDTLDLHRDLLGSAVEAYLSVTSNRLNQTMRTLTALTIGIMAPTLIAGVYGMNFALTPPNDWPGGFGFAIALMVASMAVLFVVFRLLGWLGPGERESPRGFRRRRGS